MSASVATPPSTSMRNEQRMESPRAELTMIAPSGVHTVSRSLREKKNMGNRRTAIYNDALCHAKSRVCRHLHGSQMTRREAEGTKFCGAVSRRIITCSFIILYEGPQAALFLIAYIRTEDTLNSPFEPTNHPKEEKKINNKQNKPSHRK